MRVLIMSLVFPPETGSARRVGELAHFLAQQGHQVSVITGFPSYPKGVVFEGYRKRLIHRSQWEGTVELCRMYLYTSPSRQQLAHRIRHYLTFTASAALGGLIAARPEIVYVVSPPYFLGLSGWLIARLRGARLALDVQDFWPEAPIALGYVRNPLLIKVLIGLEKFIYQQSDVIFALSDVMKERIGGRGVPSQKIERVYNWVDLAEFAPVCGDEQRGHYGLQDKFVVLFAGNMGRAQGLDSVVDTAALLRDHPDIVLALLGDGTERPRLVERTRNMGLSNVRFLDAVPESEVPLHLGMADGLLATLGRAKHREAAIPSKIQIYMASAKPLLVAAEGAAAQVMQQAGCGLVVPPDDPMTLAAAILRLRDMSLQTRWELGEAGRAYAEKHFEKDQQCRLIESRLLQLVAGSRAD
jgi:colanic acid biosynthesis glycosyl transferase WcaI